MNVETINALIALLALVLAMFTIVLQRLDMRRTYVRLSLALERPTTGLVLAHTKIDNVVATVKTLTAVFLLLGPENEDPMQTINQLIDQTGVTRPRCCPIDLRECVPLNAMQDGNNIRRLIPLPYYTVENINIADEMLAYSHSIDVSVLPTDCYSVRMYVYGEDRLYRLVQASFIVPEDASPSVPANTGSCEAISVDPVARPACRNLKHCPHRQNALSVRLGIRKSKVKTAR